MILHTRIAQTNIGMLKSKPVWQLFFNLELTAEEAELVKTYALSDYPLCFYKDNESKEELIPLDEAIKGKGGQIFTYLGKLNAMKVSLIESCASFRNYLRQIQEIRAGGGEESIEYALHPPSVAPSAGASSVPPPIHAS
jgi:hypothetical protein